jgi:hypothetical protein
MESSKNFIAVLPIEILKDVLRLLPVSSLKFFRFASKYCHKIAFQVLLETWKTIKFELSSFDAVFLSYFCLKVPTPYQFIPSILFFVSNHYFHYYRYYSDKWWTSLSTAQQLSLHFQTARNFFQKFEREHYAFNPFYFSPSSDNVRLVESLESYPAELKQLPKLSFIVLTTLMAGFEFLLTQVLMPTQDSIRIVLFHYVTPRELHVYEDWTESVSDQAAWKAHIEELWRKGPMIGYSRVQYSSIYPKLQLAQYDRLVDPLLAFRNKLTFEKCPPDRDVEESLKNFCIKWNTKLPSSDDRKKVSMFLDTLPPKNKASKCSSKFNQSVHRAFWRYMKVGTTKVALKAVSKGVTKGTDSWERSLHKHLCPQIMKLLELEIQRCLNSQEKRGIENPGENIAKVARSLELQ